MVPVAELNSHALNFPLGLADYASITGYPFEKQAFAAIPQRAYMGEKDENDAVLFDDAYSEEERLLIFLLFGRKMMPDRWQAVQKAYRDAGVAVRFETYDGIGHGTDGMVNTDVSEFYRYVIEKETNRTALQVL